MHFAVLGDVELPYNACMLALLNDKSEKHDVLCSIINHDFCVGGRRRFGIWGKSNIVRILRSHIEGANYIVTVTILQIWPL